MNITQLQRLIVDALDDVKGQDITVYNTAHLTAMFDRVVVASGTSNRQTRALAAAVRDAVKDAGGDIVSIEGEETGEWVLVDCGDAVVHIMQPAIRAYYRLEEIWGEKPVKLKLASEASAARRRKAMGLDRDDDGADDDSDTDGPDASSAKTKKVATKKVAAKKVATKKVAAKKVSPKKDGAKKISGDAVTTQKAPARKTVARKAGAKG